jgi:hypothetical protein
MFVTEHLGKNSIESVHPFTSEQLDAQEFDIREF